jgi:hypothetical protein
MWSVTILDHEAEILTTWPHVTSHLLPIAPPPQLTPSKREFNAWSKPFIDSPKAAFVCKEHQTSIYCVNQFVFLFVCFKEHQNTDTHNPSFLYFRYSRTRMRRANNMTRV